VAGKIWGEETVSMSSRPWWDMQILAGLNGKG